MKRIYLDAAAGLSPNPSSLHREGVKAARGLTAARQAAAEALGAHPDEIIFTSGGTEANNLAIFGIPKGEVIVGATEHASILESARARGGVVIAPVESNGQINLAELKKLVTLKTVLVSVMYVNNEMGAVNNVKEVAKIIRHFRRTHNTVTPYLHTDACQAANYFNLKVEQLGVDLLTLNSLKLSGTPGAGILYVRRGVPLKPLIYGGGQEAGRRAGTENVPAVNALAKALTTAVGNYEKNFKKVSALREYFIGQVLKQIPEVYLNGPPEGGAPHIVNFSFSGVRGEQVVLMLDSASVAVSTGSACALPEHDDSYVIMALGKRVDEARSAVRFSFLPTTTKGELTKTIKILKNIITNLRQANNDYAANLTL